MTRIATLERRTGGRMGLLCALAAFALSSVPPAADAFAPPPSAPLAAAFVGERSAALSTRLYSEAAAKPESSSLATAADDDDDEEEWEYVEFESLAEEDFYGSEWKVGTVMESKPNQIKETWARLVTEEGENLAVWGDGSKGKWNFDVASQFLSVSKESFGGWLGKKIWAGVVDDFYYMQGTVRGWSPISPASVLGQWQAKRLGVDPEEMGTAPWFQTEEEDDEEETEEVGTELAKAEEKDEASA